MKAKKKSINSKFVNRLGLLFSSIIKNLSEESSSRKFSYLLKSFFVSSFELLNLLFESGIVAQTIVETSVLKNKNLLFSLLDSFLDFFNSFLLCEVVVFSFDLFSSTFFLDFHILFRIFTHS